MTPDMLHDLATLETNIRDAARTALPDEGGQIYAGQLPGKAVAPYTLVQVREPSLAGPPMGGDQEVTITVAWISVGQDHTHAKRIGSAFRQFLLARDRSGTFVHPIALGTGAVLGREGAQDGHPDNVAGVQQWRESARLTVGRG